ncbi:MAG: G1 family endopeptidase [Candidatus Thermoplasmatota archaeon]|nr:G1 family endopeptidase [Candidatus Thermoplasmatota archaeon]
MLVLNGTSSNWAGFVQSGSINKVTGEFYIPSATYVGGTKPNVVGFWVGIGGFGQNTLWQAGIAVNVSSSNVETVTPWYEALPAGPVYNSGMHFNPGDLVQIWTNYSNGIATFEIKDYTTGQSWGGSIAYTTSTSTGEWIVEDIGLTVPNYNDVTWTIASTNDGNLLSPITAFTQESVGQISYCEYITEPNQFVVDYSG